MHSLLALIAFGTLAFANPVHKRAWPDEHGVQLHAKNTDQCLVVGSLSVTTPVEVGPCSDSFPGWVIASPGGEGQVRLANTQFCLDSGPGDNPAPGTLLNLKPCSTTGPCDPTIGNGQRWWTHTRGGDTWLEFAGVARMPPKHTNLCVERSDGRAMIGNCRPGHDSVRFPPQLWTS